MDPTEHPVANLTTHQRSKHEAISGDLNSHLRAGHADETWSNMIKKTSTKCCLEVPLERSFHSFQARRILLLHMALNATKLGKTGAAKRCCKEHKTRQSSNRWWKHFGCFPVPAHKNKKNRYTHTYQRMKKQTWKHQTHQTNAFMLPNCWLIVWWDVCHFKQRTSLRTRGSTCRWGVDGQWGMGVK